VAGAELFLISAWDQVTPFGDRSVNGSNGLKLPTQVW
jgi:hypothetical protein